jgi:hypothetical protein
MPLSLITKTDFIPKPQTAIASWLRRKTTLPTAAFDVLSREAKAKAYRMAGITNIRLLIHTKRIIDRGLRDGLTDSQIKRRIVTAFQQGGLNPLGDGHLRVVIRQNLLGAVAVGRDRTLRRPAVKRLLPFWQYTTVGNGTPGVNNVRPQHAALHGMVFEVDDPFWQWWTPPNGWNCRCFVIPLTEKGFKSSGKPLYTLNMGGQIVRSDGRGKAVEHDLDTDFAYPVPEDRGLAAELPGFEGGELSVSLYESAEQALQAILEQYLRDTRRIARKTKKLVKKKLGGGG